MVEVSDPAERKRITDFSKILKFKLREVLKMPISVSTAKFGEMNPYLTVSVPDWKVNFIPNEFRKQILDITYPGAKILDPNDISYGTIQANKINLRYSQWVKIYDTLYKKTSIKTDKSEFHQVEKVLYIDSDGQEHEATVESVVPGTSEYVINYNNKKVRVSSSELTKVETD